MVKGRYSIVYAKLNDDNSMQKYINRKYMIPVHKNTEKLNKHTAYSIYIEIAYFEIPLILK